MGRGPQHRWTRIIPYPPALAWYFALRAWSDAEDSTSWRLALAEDERFAQNAALWYHGMQAPLPVFGMGMRGGLAKVEAAASILMAHQMEFLGIDMAMIIVLVVVLLFGGSVTLCLGAMR